MNPSSAPLDRDRHLGSALVALQFSLLAGLVWLALNRWGTAAWPLGAWLLMAAAGVLGLWALGCNRPGNFNIHPAPRSGARLVRSGPYRHVRHPMYTAVMAVGLACAWAAASGPGSWERPALAGLAATALVLVLVAKAHLEERWLLATHADYAAYRAASWRFVPGLL